MYFQGVNIGYYVVAAIVGLIVGEFVSWMNKRLPEYKICWIYLKNIKKTLHLIIF